MPIYEYQCAACGHDVEVLQKMSAAPLTDCPACGQPELQKLISAAGFRLKGGGWYESDFKKSGQRNIASTDTKAASGESSQPACGTGACPACTTD